MTFLIDNKKNFTNLELWLATRTWSLLDDDVIIVGWEYSGGFFGRLSRQLWLFSKVSLKTFSPSYKIARMNITIQAHTIPDKMLYTCLIF